MEQELKIYKTTNNGVDYNNIYLKTKVSKATGEVFEGLKAGNYMEVEKIFAEGLEKNMGSYSFYICKVNYKGEECSFTLYENEHDTFKMIGGIGNTIRITAEAYEYNHKGKEKKALKLNFEKV